MVKALPQGQLSISTRYLSTILILIATAIPIGFRGPRLSWEWQWKDVLVNVALYVPFGVAFAQAGLDSVLVRAVMLSGVIETAQLFYVGRFSQPSDILANVAGAYLGMRTGLIFRVADNIKLTWRISIAGLIAALAWIVVCPALGGDFRPLFMIPTRFVARIVWRGGLIQSAAQTLGALATAGAVANATFVALLSSIALSTFLSRKNQLQNIAVAVLAGLSANLLLIPLNSQIRPWCLIAALFVSITFTAATLKGSQPPFQSG